MEHDDHADLSPERFRRVLGAFPTGVVVVTATGDSGTASGMAVGSFTSVSLVPPLVAFLPDRRSTSFPEIRRAGRFCVNVLSHEQEPVCRAMAVRGGDKFAGVAWAPSPRTGAPVIDGVAAWIDCELEAVHDAGDHYLALGRVLALEARPGVHPLLFLRGGYGRFESLPGPVATPVTSAPNRAGPGEHPVR